MLEGGAVAACQTGQWPLGGNTALLQKDERTRAHGEWARGGFVSGRPHSHCSIIPQEGGCGQRSAEGTVPACLTTEPTTREGASRDLAEATAALGGFHLSFTAEAFRKLDRFHFPREGLLWAGISW